MEFKAVEAVYVWSESKTNGDIETVGKLYKVPTSRMDVFNTKMLSALEKRSLMRFLQFVADWGRSEEENLNEKQLALGRSLIRPQNKERDVGQFNVFEFLEKPFSNFLSEGCRFSPKLQQMLTYGLCYHHAGSVKARTESVAPGQCSTCVYSTALALADLFKCVDALGRYGDTPFLCPMYGASEIVQAFCRLSAVWGGTFVLNRSVEFLSVSESSTAETAAIDNLEDNAGDDTRGAPVDAAGASTGHGTRGVPADDVGESKVHATGGVPADAAGESTGHATGGVPADSAGKGTGHATGGVPVDAAGEGTSRVGGEVFADAAEERKRSVHAPILLRDSVGNNIRCQNFFCSAGYWRGAPAKPVVEVVCTSAWFGAPLPAGQCVVVIPPGASYVDELGVIQELGNSHAVHVIQTDSATHVVPHGGSVLHITTTIALDTELPRPWICSAANWRAVARSQAMTAKSLISKVVSLLFLSAPNSGSDLEELFRTVILCPVYDIESCKEILQLPKGVHLCAETKQAISFDHAHDIARELFLGAFPSEEFSLHSCSSGPSGNMDCDDDDDETAYLQAALNSVGVSSQLPPREDL